jgi:energy-coupling factor transporter ATP-binding protein EcfA2
LQSIATDVPHAPEPAAAWRSVTVRYPYQERAVVQDVTLDIAPGERVLLLGPSGSGKSTLLHTLTGLVPQAIPATVDGEAWLAGMPVSSRPPAEWADTAAVLFQDADQTLCGMTVGDEIAFALENRGSPPGEIRAAIGAAMDRVGLPAEWLGRRSATLSGGERQLVAIAAALAQAAPILVADEPTASLAPHAADRLRRLIAEHRGTVLIVDHRLDGLIDRVDRVVLLDRDGRIAAEDEPRRFFLAHHDLLEAMGVWRPTASVLDRLLSERGIVLDTPPLTIDEAVTALPARDAPAIGAAVDAVRRFVADQSPPEPAPTGETLVALRDAACAPLFGPVVLDSVTLSVRAGEIVAILGRNGAGKSTLAASLAGLLRLKAGRRDGPAAGMAFQNPESQFTTGSVAEEIATSMVGSDAGAAGVDRVLGQWGLAGLAARHPFELSQGQKRRLALAALVAGAWPCLVLDEPTAGLDFAGTEAMARHARALADAGKAVVVVTHDIDFAFRLCRRAVVVGERGILFDGGFADLAADAPLLARAGLAAPSVAPLLRWLGEGAAC